MKTFIRRCFAVPSRITSLWSDLYHGIVTVAPGSTGVRLRLSYYRKRGANIARDVELHQGVVLENPDRCSLGEGVSLYPGCIVAVTKSGTFTIDKHSHLGSGCYVLVGEGQVHIGQKVAIGPQCKLIAYSNSIQGDKPIIEAKQIGTIRIGDDVLLGAGVIVLPDVNIGSHAVCGAGAVVTEDVTDWTIAVGVPARGVKDRRWTPTKIDEGALGAARPAG
jgi:maltose O-acetyltransferase